MSPECRLLDTRVEHALVPISINGNLVTREIFLPEAPASALVGDLPTAHTSSPALLQYSDSGWRAAIALAKGKITFVVRGLSYEYPAKLGLSGFVYCDDLKLDLSREQIVQDATFQNLVASIRELKPPLVLEALKTWSMVSEDHQTALLDELAELTSSGRPSVEQTQEVLQEMRQEIACGEKLELLLLWARECELQGYPENHRLICENGFPIACDRLTQVGLAPRDVFAAAYFCQFGPTYRVSTSLPFWLVLACYTAARWNHNETEHWFKKTRSHFGSFLPDLLFVCLGIRLADYYATNGQGKLSEHWSRMSMDTFHRKLSEPERFSLRAAASGEPDRGAVDMLLLDYVKQEPNIQKLKL